VRLCPPKQDRLGDALAARLPTGERLRPHRALVDGDGKPLLLVWVDEARRLGVGRSNKVDPIAEGTGPESHTVRALPVQRPLHVRGPSAII